MEHLVPQAGLVESILDSIGIDPDSLSIRGVAQLQMMITERMKNVDPSFEMSRLDIGEPGLPTPKFVIEAQIDSIRTGITNKYPPFDGVARLKEASQSYVRHAYGVDIHADNHIVTSGAMLGCFLSQRVQHQLHTKKILFLEPSFSLMKRQTTILGIPTAHLQLYQKGIHCRGQTLIDRLYTVIEQENIGSILYNTPNNPSWLTLTPEEHLGLSTIANDTGVLLIHDSAYGELEFHRDGLIPTALKTSENCMLIYSASKMGHYAGERQAIIVAHPSMMQRTCTSGNSVQFEIVQNGLYALVAGANHSAQYGFAALLEAEVDGRFNLQESCKEYARRSNFVSTVFDHAHIPRAITEPNGELYPGMYQTRVIPGYTSGKTVVALLKVGIASSPLTIFGTPVPGVRLCVSKMNEEKVYYLSERLAHLGTIL